jgi:D-glycero-D-manno-heptose 1,7-bisphosphate phosphatase
VQQLVCQLPVVSWTSGALRFGSSVLFLDRDGVINRHLDGGYVLSWDQFEPLPIFEEAVSGFREAGIALVVVSNQSCVSRGMIGLGELDRIFSSMVEYFEERRIPIAAYVFCPHQPTDACECRKPRPGMFFEAEDRFGIDLRRSVMIGDQQSDVEAGRAARVRTFRVDADDPASYLDTFRRARGLLARGVIQ